MASRNRCVLRTPMTGLLQLVTVVDPSGNPVGNAAVTDNGGESVVPDFGTFAGNDIAGGREFGVSQRGQLTRARVCYKLFLTLQRSRADRGHSAKRCARSATTGEFYAA